MYNTNYHNQDLSNTSILVTGGAGFIGSNIVEYLVKFNCGKIIILDNLSTGFKENINRFLDLSNLEFINGDIRDLETCQNACKGIDYVLHQAALGSVPRSIEDPITTNNVNVGGFLNMLVAVRTQKVKRLVYAASSSTYGDSKELPKVEDRIGKPLSPYAVTKYVNELYADVFAKTYGIETIGLRYFNVFGPRQSPKGEYAAVIPLFIEAVKNNVSAYINGDGEQTRDFTFIENVVQANIKALFTVNPSAINDVFNVACGDRTSLNELWTMINDIQNKIIIPKYRKERLGDVKDSLASIDKIKSKIGYQPKIDLINGLRKTILE